MVSAERKMCDKAEINRCRTASNGVQVAEELIPDKGKTKIKESSDNVLRMQFYVGRWST
jgi:hypothetical protein